jgi:hypothetical protein
MSILTEISQMTGTGTVIKSPIIWLYASSISVGAVVLWKYWQNRVGTASNRHQRKLIVHWSQVSLPTYGGILSFSSTLSARRLGTKGREECMSAYAKVCFSASYLNRLLTRLWIGSDHTFPDIRWLGGAGA